MQSACSISEVTGCSGQVLILIERAKDTIELSAVNNAFSDNILQIKISNPDQPHLTIIDLPSLIHSKNKVQKAADVKLVQQLVQSYMSSSWSIVLTVMSAKNDYAKQVVLQLAREINLKGVRTLSVITKPDTLPVGSESKTVFVVLC